MKFSGATPLKYVIFADRSRRIDLKEPGVKLICWYCKRPEDRAYVNVIYENGEDMMIYDIDEVVSV